MNKLLQKTLAFALALLMVIASTAIIASAEETETEAVATGTEAASDPETGDSLRNVARDEGVSYSLARLVGDPGSEEEGAAGFVSYLADDDCTKLTDGETNPNGAEIPKKAVGLTGTCRTMRIKFDFGAEKTVSKIALLNMRNSYKRDYNGKPAGNRGYELDTILVQAGEDELAMLEVETENTEEPYVDAEGNESNEYFKVFVTLTEAVTTRYLWIDVQTAQPTGTYDPVDDIGAYLVSLDEVEIYGEDAGDAPVASESEASETEAVPTEVEEEGEFEMDAVANYIPANGEGDKIEVVISPKNIKSENGLMAVSFTLEYDTSKVTPNEVAPDPEKPEFYDKLITKSPMYTMSVPGTDLEVATSAYENISRNYDGYYEFSFLDKISYPMQKEGETIDARLKNDGDLVITVPFTVNEGVAEGEEIVFVIKAVGGTDAGNADTQPFSVDGKGTKAIAYGGGVAPSETETQPEASESESQPEASESESQPEASESESQPEASESESQPEASETQPVVPPTGSSSIAIIVVLAALSLVGCAIVVKKVRD